MALRHRVERFQFSRPRRDPLGDVIAGSPGTAGDSQRDLRIGITRSGTGMDRRPAADFGFPSVSPAADLGDGTPDPDAPRLEVDVLDAETHQLAEPQAGISQQRHDVALGSARLSQCGDLTCREVGVSRLSLRWKLRARAGFRDGSRPSSIA